MTEGMTPDQGPSAGAMLRQAREAAGLHVATLAANLKVPVRKLEALEEDRYDQLGDAVFVRALASSVCRTLKCDPQPVLARLPQTERPRLVPDNSGINAPFRAPGDGPKPGWLDQVSRPVVLTVVALLLAAVVLIFLPVARNDAPPQPAQSDPVMPPSGEQVAVNTVPGAATPVAPLGVSPAPAEPVAPPPAVVPAPAAPAAVAAAPASAAPGLRAAASMPRAVAAASAPAVLAAPAVAAASAAAVAASAPLPRGIVVFRTRAPSWIEVTDVNGNAVLRRTLDAGETAGVSGALPLSVTIGSVEATEVQVRGKPFNLGPVSRDNVARFEVK